MREKLHILEQQKSPDSSQSGLIPNDTRSDPLLIWARNSAEGHQARQPRPLEQQIEAFSQNADDKWCGELGTMFNLPGMPGCSVEFQQQKADEQPHLFYSFLTKQNLKMVFHGPENFDEHLIEMNAYEILAWCPAKYIWVYCLACRRFCCPPQDHRNSELHRKRLRWHSEVSDEVFRQWVMRLPPKREAFYEHFR